MECLRPVKYRVNNSQKRVQKEVHWIGNKNLQVSGEGQGETEGLYMQRPYDM